MSHTPGPWRATAHYGAVVADTETGCDDAENVAAYGGHLVCESLARRNAYLVAAAPDLYAALDLIRRYVQWQPDGPTLKIVEAALAKAKGEA